MTRDLFSDVARAIRRRFVSKATDRSETEAPDTVESLRDVEGIPIALLERLLIEEIKIKKTRMVVRSLQFFAVLAAVIITDCSSSELLSESFHKFLEMFLY